MIPLVVVFWVVWFLNFSTRTILSPLLPLIEDELSISHALAGGFLTFVSLGYTAALLISGLISIRIGHRRTIVVGFVIVAVALIFLKYATTYFSLVILMTLIGMGAGVYLPNSIPLITASLEKRHWGKAFGVHETATAFSLFLVPILVSLGLRFFHWRTLFLLLGCACIIALGFFWAYAPDPRPKKREEAPLFSMLRNWNFWIMSLLWAVAVAASLGVYYTMPLFLVTERALSLELANKMFGISRAGGIVGIFLAGFLADRYETRRILFLVFLTTGVSTIGLALARTFPLLMAILVVQSPFSSAYFPVALVATSKVTTLTERSLFAAVTMALGGGIGLALAPPLLGAVADVWSFQTGIVFLGVLTSLTSLSLKVFREV